MMSAWLAGQRHSGLVHIVYNVTLVRLYRRNDLAQVYPIARG
jgi:hypothetical protein